MKTFDDQVMRTEDGVPLKIALKRAERSRNLRALALVAPLFLFIVLTFAAPIGMLLFRAIYDPDLARNLPATTEAIRSWNGEGLPDEPVFAALAADLKAAQENKTAGQIGKRLNYEMSGTRSKILATARMVAKLESGPYKEAFLKQDPRIWGQPDVWHILKRETKPFTGFYLLAALDHQFDSNGNIVRTAPDQAIFVDIFIRTLWIAFLVTAFTLLLGYPIAYLLASLPTSTSNLLMILVLVPFWTSLLVRTTAWVVLLQTNGVINDALIWLGILQERVQLIFNRGGTVLAMTHIQLPFTILPIYSVMKTISPSYMRAARSLGGGPFYSFWRIYFPQTVPGIGAGCLLTFILSLGYYITPALVGGPADQMISYFVALYTNTELNWGMASALGALLLAMTLILYLVYNRLVGIDKVKLG
ncbi:ABC transporter permease [Dongia soli]|uniref:ABC transporter permease n=1 Tax=Dongia soli TaxID=600628 RepID=A0ABU5EG06_9PROT|nr:ABC transporter permease [Dongia soli]MDY0885343.1 ABC transporter permease [Dongia soli]